MFHFSNFSVTDIPELQASNYGLSESETYPTEGLLFGHANNLAKLSDVTEYLKKVYCNTVAVDFTAVEVSFTSVTIGNLTELPFIPAPPELCFNRNVNIYML